MIQNSPNRFLKTEPLLGILSLLLLMLGCFFILRHFFAALAWAAIFTYSLYPLQQLFTKWFRGRRTLAACVVSLTVMTVITGPIVLIGVNIAQDGRELGNATRNWFANVSTTPPSWIKKTPVIGNEIEHYWQSFADSKGNWIDQLEYEVSKAPRAKIAIETENGIIVQDPTPAPPSPTGHFESHAKPPSTHENATSDSNSQFITTPKIISALGQVLAWARSGLLNTSVAILSGIAQMLISAFLAFFLLRDSAAISQRLAVAVEHLAGERSKHLLKIAGNTVQGVIFGILGTAIAQAVLAGLGFWIAGVPGYLLLSVLTFFLAVLPFGPPLIWIPASIWLFSQGQTGHAIGLAAWGLLAISSIDNVLRPLLISQGNDMPYALVFCGVIGGALAFGVVGIFIGPIVLAVAYRLLDEWTTMESLKAPSSNPNELSPLPNPSP